MRIGINCRTILNPGFGEGAGVGHYTYYLVKHLIRMDQENQYFLYFDELIGDQAIDEVTGGAPNVTVRRFPFHQYKKFLPFAYSHVLVTAFLGKDKLDIFHAPSGILPYTYHGTSVITIHDLAIYKHPEWFPDGRISKNVSTKMLVPKAVDAVNKIIAPSESTKNDIMELFSVNPQKIVVIPEGVDLPKDPESQEFKDLMNIVKEKYNISRPFFLTLGTLEPRKNIGLTLRALKQILEEMPEILRGKEFLIAGVKGWNYQTVFDLINEINDKAEKKIDHKLVRYLGYLPHRDKFPLMALSIFFVFPTLYEGFGLPVLEALRLGIPVITSNVSSVPEITGDAAFLINPEDPDSMKDALRKFLRNSALLEEYSEKGKLRSLKFTWEETARKTIEVYKSLQ